MEDRKVYRRKQLEHELSLSRSTIYSWIKQGRFPPQTRFGPGVVGWYADVIEKWLQDRKNGDWLGRRYDQEGE